MFIKNVIKLLLLLSLFGCSSSQEIVGYTEKGVVVKECRMILFAFIPYVDCKIVEQPMSGAVKSNSVSVSADVKTTAQ